MLEYFVSKGVQYENKKTGKTIRITSVAQLMTLTQETYPKQKEDKAQRPAMNVVSAIIAYVKDYIKYVNDPEAYPEYEGYKYIFENFEYLTGLQVELITRDPDFDSSDIDLPEAEAIKKAMKARKDDSAKRIELDSVIKVVRANAFAQFVVDTLKDNFPVLDYNRAVESPSEYFTNKFNILPKRVQQLFLHITDKADKTIEQTDKDIEAELEAVDTNEVGDLLNIEVEEIENERLRIQAIEVDQDMQELENQCGKLLDSLDPDPAGLGPDAGSDSDSDSNSNGNNDGRV